MTAMRSVKKAAYKRMVRAVRKHAAHSIAGWTCACGQPATCMSVRVDDLPAPPGSLSAQGWTIARQRVADEIARREPTCRPCACRRGAVSRRIIADLRRDPVSVSRRIREVIDGI